MFFQILALAASLEFGFMNGGIYNYSGLNEGWKEIGTLYTSINATVNYKFLYVGGGMDCYFTPKSWNNYMPFQMTYILKAGLDFNTVQIGYEHDCFHPISPYSTIIGNEIKPKYEGGSNKFFVKIKTK